MISMLPARSSVALFHVIGDMVRSNETDSMKSIIDFEDPLRNSDSGAPAMKHWTDGTSSLGRRVTSLKRFDSRGVPFLLRLALVIVAAAVLATDVCAEDGVPNKLQNTAAELRVTVTGHDFNRPDQFPGLGRFSWPGNVAQMPDGELLLVHSAGYYHVSFAQPCLIEPATRKRWLASGWPLDFDAPTGGRSMLVRSRDGGQSWSKPTTIVDLPWDDAPYGLLRCNDGTLLCFINVQASWYGYEKAPVSFATQLSGLNSQQCVVRSTDSGRTWSAPIWLESPGSFYERSHAQPLLLPSGRILLPAYCKSRSEDRLFGAIHVSDDNGKTWRLLSTLQRPGSDTASSTSGNIDEPAIALLPDGRLFLITRPDGGWFTSDDEGLTWQFQGQLVTSGKFKAPRVFALEDGTIVCVCTWRNLQVFIGKNGGTAWVGPLDLDSSSYGYPGGILLENDSMLISYCSSGKAPNSIHLIRFQVNEDRSGIELLPVSNLQTFVR